jgi:hypothetical protein
MARKLTRAALIDELARLMATANVYGTGGVNESEMDCEMIDAEALAATDIASAFSLDREKLARAVARHERRILRDDPPED